MYEMNRTLFTMSHDIENPAQHSFVPETAAIFRNKEEEYSYEIGMIDTDWMAGFMEYGILRRFNHSFRTREDALKWCVDDWMEHRKD